MKKTIEVQIRRINAWRAATVYATCTLAAITLFSPLVIFIGFVRSSNDGFSMIGSLLVFAFVYPIMAFIFTAITTSIYNLVVRMTGSGFSVEIEAPSIVEYSYSAPSSLTGFVP
jgi:hypothetical protein